MIFTVVLLCALCWSVQGSGIAHGVAPVLPAPIVTAASSQYFERTFNRLIAAPSLLEPVVPIVPATPVIPATQVPQVIVQPTRTVPLPVPVPVTPSQNVPVDPNVAIAIATAHAAAPVATILLPPFPFGPPPQLGFVPSSPPAVPDEDRKESTTQITTKGQVTTVREPEQTTPLPLPSNTATAFAQAPPLDENINFRQYGPPLPSYQSPRPQKLKTSVEIVPVPLQYIAPPPLNLAHVKPVKLIHKFIPARTKVIVQTVRVPARIISVRAPVSTRSRLVAPNNLRQRSAVAREVELTTFRPFPRPNTKPPRI